MIKQQKTFQKNREFVKNKDHLKRRTENGILNITSGTNNTIFNVSAANGRTLFKTTCGKSFKNAKKSTPHAFQVALSSCLNKIRELGISSIEIVIRTHGGTNTARDGLSEIANSGLRVTRICDKTSTPHNGCRPPKAPKK